MRESAAAAAAAAEAAATLTLWKGYILLPKCIAPVQIVESADVVVCCGTVWTDYSTVGYSLLLRPDHTINVGVFAWPQCTFSSWA
eukprot:scaffold207344_cov19-Tisochrysis_lutea.AAC.1